MFLRPSVQTLNSIEIFRNIRTIPFNLLAIVPGEMLNTFAAKWTSWGPLKSNESCESFPGKCAGAGRGKRPQKQPTQFSVGGAVETINKCEIDPDRGRTSSASSGSQCKMELLNFWFLVNWAGLSSPLFLCAGFPLFPLFFPLQTIHNTDHRSWRSPWDSEPPSSSLSSASSSFCGGLYISVSFSGIVTVSFWQHSGVLFCRTLAAVLHCFWPLVWRHSHLPLLLLLLPWLWSPSSLSVSFGFVCSAIELMISVCIAHFMHNFRKFSLRSCTTDVRRGSERKSEIEI